MEQIIDLGRSSDRRFSDLSVSNHQVVPDQVQLSRFRLNPFAQNRLDCSFVENDLYLRVFVSAWLNRFQSLPRIPELFKPFLPHFERTI